MLKKVSKAANNAKAKLRSRVQNVTFAQVIVPLWALLHGFIGGVIVSACIVLIIMAAGGPIGTAIGLTIVLGCGLVGACICVAKFQGITKDYFEYMKNRTSPQTKESGMSPLPRFSKDGTKQSPVDPSAENNKSASFGFKGFVTKLRSIPDRRSAPAKRSEVDVETESSHTPG